jgi:hypothetical protein
VYCEQFHRRVVSAIAPMQLVQTRRIADQRPLDLVDCLFELRMSASSPRETARLVTKHLAKLFHAQHPSIYIPIDSDHSGKSIKIDGQSPTTDADVERFVDLSDVLDRYKSDALTGISISLTPSLNISHLRPHSSATSASAPSVDTAEDCRRTSVTFPVFKGRQTVMILEWTNPDPSTEGGGFDDVRIATETLYHDSNPDHRLVMTEYTGALECILAQWFKPANGLIYQLNELESYETETDRENMLIERIVADSYHSKGSDDITHSS